MPPEAITEITGLDPTYSAREAAAVLGRSFSWVDQRVRNGDFVRPDGTVIEPKRTAGCYRYFTTDMLQDIAKCCYRHRWFSLKEVKSTFLELAMDIHCDPGDDEVPS
jgi:hypothetical protein